MDHPYMVLSQSTLMTART